ncbi:MAG TPA: hypothetical protein H9713_09965 [Candidatus Mediterraneibacter surreyensis]|nr:hypothetical protein [Candidatus Mediterraneibacter surreyensis]
MANETTVNRTFKSTVFIMVFQDKKNLLELYNAMTGKHYTDPEQLEINTLENAVYMSMKNDLSFLIDGRLSLYEHQSTYNPNLPLRFLIYISQLYAGMTRNENLYGTKTVQIPPPEFVIFYNGEKDMPEETLLKLSDMYGVKVKDPKLELEAVMLNISGSNNSRLKEACRTLKDYAVYTDKIRLYSKEQTLEEAVEKAINECIAENVLKDFLTKHRAEAKAMSIFEYDQEKHIRQEREEAWEEGRTSGLKEGRASGMKEGRASGLKLAETIFRLFREGKTAEEISACCDLPAEQIRELLGQEKQ